MSEKRKIVKVQLEFDDGRILLLEGADAEEWERHVGSLEVFALNHGFRHVDLPWEVLQQQPDGCVRILGLLRDVGDYNHRVD